MMAASSRDANEPNASLVHSIYAESCGTAMLSSAVMSAIGIDQTIAESAIARSAYNGGIDETKSSVPYAPPQTTQQFRFDR